MAFINLTKEIMDSFWKLMLWVPLAPKCGAIKRKWIWIWTYKYAEPKSLIWSEFWFALYKTYVFPFKAWIFFLLREVSARLKWVKALWELKMTLLILKCYTNSTAYYYYFTTKVNGWYFQQKQDHLNCKNSLELNELLIRSKRANCTVLHGRHCSGCGHTSPSPSQNLLTLYLGKSNLEKNADCYSRYC